MSFINKINNSEPKIDSWGTPDVSFYNNVLGYVSDIRKKTP